MHEHSGTGGEWRGNQRQTLDSYAPTGDHARKMRRLTAIAARTFHVATALAAAIGGLVLLGWIFNIQFLKSVHPAWGTMKINTALMLLLAAAGLWCLRDEQAPAWRRRLGQSFGAGVGLIGLLTLCEFLYGWDPGIDQLLVRDLPGGVGAIYPGRMAPLTALCFSLIGSALILIGMGRRGAQAAQALALISVALVHLGLTGYALNVYSLYRWLNSTVAIHTLIGLGALVAAILCARPRTRLMVMLLSPEAGGMLMRRMLPAALILPLLIGMARLRGEHSGYYETPVGVAIMVLSISFSMLALTEWTAHILNEAAAERAAAEHLRRQGERDFREAFAHAPIGMVINDLQGRFLQVNAAYCRITGFEAEELLRPDFDFMRITHPEDRERNAAEYRKLLTGEIPAFFVEKRYIRKDGEIVWIRVSASLRRDAEGRRCQIVGLVEDIAQRKQAEDALRESEQRLRATFHHAGVGIVEVDADDRFIAVNERVCSTLGYSCDELMRLNVHLLTAPEDRALSDRFNAELHEGCRDRIDYEKRYLRKDGSPRWVHVTVSPIRDQSGHWQRSIATIEDISERKRAEEALHEKSERLSLAIDGSQGAEWEIPVDPARALGMADDIVISTRHRAFLGLQDHELPNNLSAWLSRIHPDDLAAVQSSLEAHAQGDAPSYRTEYRIRHKDGSWRWLSSTGRLYRDAAGQPVRWVGMDWDITEQKLAEEAARNREALLNAIVDCLPVGLLIFGADGKLARMNRAITELWGEPPATMDFQDYEQWRGYWPDTGQRLKAHEWPCARAMHTGAAVTEVLEIERFDNGSTGSNWSTRPPSWIPATV